MIRITFERSAASFEPRSKIRGQVEWSELEPPPDLFEVRLIWFTRGKGTQDLEIADSQECLGARASGQVAFELQAPAHPHSFSGKLISLIWAVEAIARPSDDAETIEITIAPAGREILLAGGEEESDA